MMRIDIRTLAAGFSGLLVMGCVGQTEQTPKPGQKGRALGLNLLQDGSFEDLSPRALNPDDPTPWFGEEPGRTLIVQGNALSGTQFARLTGGGPQSFLFQRFTAQPFTNYVFTFHHRGGASSSFTGSVRIRYLGPWHNPFTDPNGPGDECADCYDVPSIGFKADFEEDLDLHKQWICGTALDGSSSGWQEVTINCTTGPETEVAVVFYGEFGPDFIDIDDVSVQATDCTPDCTTGSCGSPDGCGGSCGNVCDPGCTGHCSNGGRDCDETGVDCGGVSCAACISSPCTNTYGGQSGFQLCFENSTECDFEAVKPGQSCDQICGAGGGQCLRAYGNDSADPCVALSQPPDGCTRTDRYDDICVCSL